MSATACRRARRARPSASPPPRLKFFNSADDTPLAGGLLYTYEAGTTTPLATYTDAGGGTPNTQPIELDANGEADVWLSNVKYKFILKDADDVEIWTIDNIASHYIYDDNITWSGDHIFNGSITLNGSIGGDLTFTGSTTVDNNLYVTGNLTVDGNSNLAGTVTVDELSTSLITLGAAGTISDDIGVMELAGANNVTISVDTAAFTYDFQESGLLRLPVETPVNDLDAASKGYVDDTVALAAPDGLVPVAIGAVVSNALVTGSIGVTSVTKTGTGQYDILLSSATTSTGKTIVFTMIRAPLPDDRNYSANASVTSTTPVAVQTGGGNTYTRGDLDFNFVVYSLP